MKMLKILCCVVGGLAIVCGSSLAWFALQLAPDVETGSASPDVAIATLDDGSLLLSSLRGKVVLLDFWTST